jgi:hypothetical protein
MSAGAKPPIATVAGLKGAALTLALHARLAKGGSLFIYRCDTWPRLQVKKARQSRAEPMVQTIYVDQREVPGGDLQAAVDKLNADPPAETPADGVAP